MLSKKTKKKVIAALIGLGLIGGTFTALARADVGETVLTWYNSKLSASSQAVGTAVGAHYDGIIEGYNLGIQQQLKTNVDNVDAAAVTEVARASEAISAETKEYLDELEAIKAQIIARMNNDYAAILATNEDNNAGKSDALVVLHTNDYIAQLGSAETTSLSKVETDVSAVKNAKITELQEGITAATNALEALMAEKQATTSNAAIADLDQWMTITKDTLAEFRNAYELEIKTAITTKGTELETAAMAELDQALEDALGALVPIPQ